MTKQESKLYLADVKKVLDKQVNAFKKATAFGVENNNVWDILIGIDDLAKNIQSIRDTIVTTMGIKEDGHYDE